MLRMLIPVPPAWSRASALRPRPCAAGERFPWGKRWAVGRCRPVLRSVDKERLFRDSRFGQRVRNKIDAASRELEAENSRLMEELTAREEELDRCAIPCRKRNFAPRPTLSISGPRPSGRIRRKNWPAFRNSRTRNAGASSPPSGLPAKGAATAGRANPDRGAGGDHRGSRHGHDRACHRRDRRRDRRWRAAPLSR